MTQPVISLIYRNQGLTMELSSVHTTVNVTYWPALISHIRSAKKMSQEDFAEAVFSNQATVSRWEKGQVVPSFDKQKKIDQWIQPTPICQFQQRSSLYCLLPQINGG